MTRRRPWGLRVLLAALVLPVTIAARHVPGPVWAVAASAVTALARAYLAVSAHVWAVLGAAAVAALGRLVLGAARFARMPAAAKRHYRFALWHRWRWRWLARSLDLAYEDRHQHAVRPVAFGTAAPMPAARPARPRLRFPRARFRATVHGFDAAVRTVPQVGREQLEKSAVHIADQWRCVRVSVSQPAPGQVLLRGLRKDPLTEPVPAAILPAWDRRHLMLGRDEHGSLRAVDLANLSGSVIAGNPGRGKTESAQSLAVQLVSSPAVELFILDGGDGTDWSVWEPAAVAYCGDDLAAAEDFLLEMHGGMMARRRNLRADLGTGNAWSTGPTRAYPLRWLVIEETSAFFDLDAARGDRDRERRVRACRALAGHLLKRGRAPLYHTTLICQKPTTTGGLPPDLRDMAGLRWSFGVATTETAVAALGDDIRRFETMSPTLLQEDDYVGVATVLLRTGMDPFTRVKFPRIGDDLPARAASQAAARRLVTAGEVSGNGPNRTTDVPLAAASVTWADLTGEDQA